MQSLAAVREKSRFIDLMRRLWLNRELYVFISPALFFLLLLNLLPSLYAMWISLFDKMLGKPDPEFIGLANFSRFISDPRFWITLGTTMKFALGVAVVSIVFGFGMALLLNQRIRFRGLFRALFLLPWIFSDPVAALMWRWILDIKLGVINAALDTLGLATQRWLTEPLSAMALLVIVVVWKGFGFQMLVMMASLQGIPSELFEAAAIDGASIIQSFRHITLPLMRRLLMILFILTFLGSIGAINLIISLTGGGPFRSTETIGLYMYQNAFSYLKVGYASSISLFFTLLTMLILVPFMYVYMRGLGRTRHNGSGITS